MEPKKYFAEILGTFALVFFGTGAIIINQQTNGAITHMGVSITFGLIVMVMIYALGNISGAHLNPAVTIAFFVAGKFKLKGVAPYILAQTIGAFLASYLLFVLFPENEVLGSTLPSGTVWQSFILEVILTYFLMLVILNVATGSKEQGLFAGIAIGATVALEAIFAGPVCGASMNPIRSLSPAVISGHTESLWVYLIACPIGAILSVPTWKFLNNKSKL